MTNQFELTISVHKKTQCVSARELHEKLGVKSRFYDWFKRMCSYGFSENIDYKRVTQKKVTLGGEQDSVDYYVFVDMAKQICMLQRNEKGMMYRRYLLEIERLYKEKQSAEYKEARQKSIEVRNTFTDELKNRGYSKRYEYINTTKAMKKPLGIAHKKDDMSVKELKAVRASEAMASLLLDDEYGYQEVNPVCVEASETVQKALERKYMARLAS